MKKIIIISVVVILLMGIFSFLYFDYQKKEEIRIQKQKQTNILNNIKNNYNKYVITNKQSTLYKLQDNKYIKIGSVDKDIELILKDKKINNYKDIYFELENIPYYIKYDCVSKINNYSVLDNYYKNYLPFDENVVTKLRTNFYLDNKIIYSINEALSLPIIIKDSNKYYVEYDKRLFYITDEDVERVDANINNTDEVAEEIAVITYHYTYNKEAGERCKNGIICHEEKQVDSHLKYLKENNFYSLKMKDVELFLDGKIRLPKKSVVITIDDGWWVPRFSSLLTNYNLNGTLFLIGKLGTIDIYETEYLKVHSHTYDLHEPGYCPGGQGSQIKCYPKDKILEDLKKSRETLKNTTVFCYPFYEYNDYAIGILKEAGFTMAFKGGMYKMKSGIDKMKIPRYTIHNTTTVEQLSKIVN